MRGPGTYIFVIFEECNNVFKLRSDPRLVRMMEQGILPLLHHHHFFFRAQVSAASVMKMMMNDENKSYFNAGRKERDPPLSA